MHKQRFWAIVHKDTNKVSKGISEYKIYKTRTQARIMNNLWHKKKSGNYKVVSLVVNEMVSNVTGEY